MEGWIKLHRRFLEWEWFNKPEMVQLYIYFLLKANYEPKQFQGVFLEAGQIVTTNSKIRLETGLSEQQIRTCIKRLISTNEITYKATKQFAIVTICKYDNYQMIETRTNEGNNKGSNEQATKQQRTSNEAATNIQRSEEYNILLPPAYEEVDLGECYRVLLNSPSWWEVFCMNNHLTPDQFKDYLKQFFCHLQNTGETMKSEKEGKYHFSCWYNKIIEIEKKQKQNEADRKPSKTDKAQQLFNEYEAVNNGGSPFTAGAKLPDL
ncbi:DUF7833 domain-containing protein [Phocaeicola sp.]